jgi:hypothetical protein
METLTQTQKGELKMETVDSGDERIPHLTGGLRRWYDVVEQRFVTAATAYIP